MPVTSTGMTARASGEVVIHRLLAHEAFDAVLTVFTAYAAAPIAGVEAVRALARGPVDVDLAERELVHAAHDTPVVAGEHVGREAIVGIVGVGERLIEIGHRHCRDHRTEGLLLHDGEVVGPHREHRGEEPWPRSNCVPTDLMSVSCVAFC